MSQTLGQTWEEEAQERVERVRRETALLAQRADLRALLEDRFGTLPEDVTRRIDRAEDAERLKAALIQVHRMKRLEELQV